jgi:hypothetical protein
MVAIWLSLGHVNAVQLRRFLRLALCPISIYLNQAIQRVRLGRRATSEAFLRRKTSLI